MKRAFCLLMGAALAGCASPQPDYQRPAAPVPAHWPAADAESGQVDIAWRRFFVDDGLRETIAQALANNRDLRVAAANVQAARAQYRIQDAARLPAVQLQGKADRQLTRGGDPSLAADSRGVSAGLGVSAFELDLFGRVRSLSDAQWRRYLASEAGAQAARVSLIAETANAYLTLAADRSQLAAARTTLRSAERSLELTRERLRLGASSALDVSAMETMRQQARADVARYQGQAERDRLALQLLVGVELDQTRLPAALEDRPYTLAALPADAPADALLRRPDVRQAENLLRAAHADVDAARAGLWPKLGLSASSGLSGVTLAGLLNAPVRALSLALDASLPALDSGAAKAGVDQAEAQRLAALAAYEKALQNGFREVADALSQRQALAEEKQARQAALASAEGSLRLAEARYRQGLDGYLSLLEAQRTAQAARLQWIGAHLAEAENMAALYRSLGGGLES
ncbi:efflux transporter outer membrane subunit [Chromobacterium violaceum]|uniref:efflux transporter outer membrane subunit n=1 Tax=Chromobacterium violaceum TaxID=536 RepID=UPI001E364A69|nr:efflux transporter outer membrane subunit [Chromobacterium violaceum]MCD0494317.1 efflux transporter outer membrane subunit [Chromobacterium violaceum]